MALNFGFPQSQWDAAKTEAREQLVAVARRRSLVTYGDLARVIQTIKFNADDDSLHKMLGQISVVENEAGRGMLSVVVVRRDNHYPGSGFFELAQNLGRDTRDSVKFWSDELRRS